MRRGCCNDRLSPPSACGHWRVFYKRSAAGRTAQLVEAELVALRAGGGAAVRITFTRSGTRSAVTVTPVLLPPSNSSSGPMSNRLYLGISGGIGFQRQSRWPSPRCFGR